MSKPAFVFCCIDGEIAVSKKELNAIYSNHKGLFLNQLVSRHFEEGKVVVKSEVKYVAAAIRCHTLKCSYNCQYVNVLSEIDPADVRNVYNTLIRPYCLVPQPEINYLRSINLMTAEMTAARKKEYHNVIYPFSQDNICYLGGENALNLLLGAPLEMSQEFTIVNCGVSRSNQVSAFAEIFCDYGEELNYNLLRYVSCIDLPRDPSYKEMNFMTFLRKTYNMYPLLCEEKGVLYLAANKKELNIDEIRALNVDHLRDQVDMVIEFNYKNKYIKCGDKHFKVRIVEKGQTLLSKEYGICPFLSVTYHPEYGFASYYMQSLLLRELTFSTGDFIKYAKYIKKYSRHIKLRIM